MCVVEKNLPGGEAGIVAAKKIGKERKADVYGPADVKKAKATMEKRKSKMS